MSRSSTASRASTGTSEPILARGRRLAARALSHNLVLVSAALALLIVVFFYDIVFLGRTLLTSSVQQGVMGLSPPFGYPGQPDYNPYLIDPAASAVGAEPTFEKMARLIRDIEIPLWNSNVSLGRPFIAQATDANFSPIRLLVLVWPSPEMWDGFLLARFFVAGLFTYLLAKRLDLARPAAFGAAVAYTFSGYLMLYVNTEHSDIAMMVPVLLYIFELLLEQPGPGRAAFAVAAVALVVLAHNPQPAVLLLLYGSAYYLARSLTLLRSTDGFRLRPRLLSLALVLGAGVGITAFRLVPFLELTGGLGFEGLGAHAHSDRGLGFDRLRSLISLFVPYFDGPPIGNFQGTGFTGVRNYVGVVASLLALIALWNRPAMRRCGWFFLAAAVVIVAKHYGVPAVNWLGRFPGLQVIDFPMYSPPAVAFSVAMLAGLGLDRLSRAGWRRWHLPVVTIGLASLLGWLVWLNRGILGSIPDGHLVVQFGFAAGLIVAATATVLAARSALVPPAAGMVLLVGLIAIELFAITMPTRGDVADFGSAVYERDNFPVIERPRRYDAFTEPPYVRFLKEDTSKYRVVGTDYFLYPNTSEAYNIDDIRGLTGISVARYLEYIREFVEPDGRGHRFTGAHWPPLDTKGGVSLLSNNPMFDLLNVKYIIAPRGLPLAYDYDLAERFLPAEPVEGAGVRLDVFEINGEDDVVLFQHPISSLSYAFTPRQESRFLLFRLALDPRVWRPDRGDGVLFRVSVRQDGNEEALFSRWVDPKNNPEDRRWIDGVVDLSPYLGQTVTLVLSTSPGETSAWDWAGWGGLRLAPTPETASDRPSSSQFDLVYDGEVQIYQNRSALSRAFVVHRAVLAPGQDAAIELLKRPGFDPSTEAVVEGGLSDDRLAALAASPIVDGSSVEITHYSDSRVELLARMESPGLLVLSDTYYPGWKAYVDGKQAPVHPTDLALRSVFLPAGEHKVEFVFSPGSFRLGLAITIGSLAVLMLYGAWGPTNRTLSGWMSRRPKGR